MEIRVKIVFLLLSLFLLQLCKCNFIAFLSQVPSRTEYLIQTYSFPILRLVQNLVRKSWLRSRVLFRYNSYHLISRYSGLLLGPPYMRHLLPIEDAVKGRAPLPEAPFLAHKFQNLSSLC